MTLIYATAFAQESPPDTPPRISVSFGPEQIWRPQQNALQALVACSPPATFTCIRQVMQDNGASPDAIAIYALTGWFLWDLPDAGGPIQVGTVLSPWRANENLQTALLGGIPPVVFVERETPTCEAENSRTLLDLKRQHPNALFWGSGAGLSSIETRPDGGQRFVFNYRVLDGCHACAILGYVPRRLRFRTGRNV